MFVLLVIAYCISALLLIPTSLRNLKNKPINTKTVQICSGLSIIITVPILSLYMASIHHGIVALVLCIPLIVSGLIGFANAIEREMK